MKQLITAILLTLLISAQAFAGQLVLKLTDRNTGRTEIVKPGARITYQLLSDSSMHEGQLERLTAFELQVNGQLISLTRIRVLSSYSKGSLITEKVAKGFGHVLSVTGRVMTYAGMEILSNDIYLFPVAGTVTVAGACMWGVGYVIEEGTEAISGKRLHYSLDAEIISKGRKPVVEDDIFR
jgi:hypothetical protein